MSSKVRDAKALYDFEGDEDNQLTIVAGQNIKVIGDVTPENWILAKSSNGKEGYIPDGYFEIIKSKPPLPPQPGNSSSSGESGAPKRGGYKVKQVGDGKLLETKDMFSVFVYQLEWFTIPCVFLAAFLSFMYSTPSVSAVRWRMGICSWLTFVLAAFAAYICGVNRTKFSLCGSPAMARFVVFLLSGLLLCAAYPVGVGSGVVALLCAFFELRCKMKGLDELPEEVTDSWCAQMFGGAQSCGSSKLITFFIVLIVDAGTFAWGYVDGYNVALESNEAELSSWLEPVANAFMFGFGRIITVNLCLILLFQCKGIIGCLMSLCKDGKFCCCKGGDDNNNNSEDGSSAVISFLHRCMGYSIVVAMFLHLICVYFTHEDSGATKSFLDAYGWETFGSGALCLFAMAFVVASSNGQLADRDKRLFKQTHRQSIFVVFILIAHGKGFISTYYWMLIVGPILIWSCDLFIRYIKN